MNLSFRQLKLFLALADTGSVSKAAQACHVTQPTASAQLREMADAVGVPLHEVVSRRVHLTDAGRDLAQTARAMVDEWAAFEQRISAVKGLRRGKLRVAVVSTAKYFVPRFLGQFCARYPEVDISLEVLNRDGVVQRLREHRDHLYIMSVPPADLDLEDEVFMPNPLVAIAASHHPLATAGSPESPLPLQALQDQRFILRERGSGTRMAVDAHFRRCGFAPQLRLELGSIEAIKEAVAANLGVSVVSAHSLAGTAGVAVLNVAGFPIASHWHVVWRKGQQLSPIAQVFRAHLLQGATPARPETTPHEPKRDDPGGPLEI